ncbi:HEAT repeat domain-containing protein [Kitasatospora sp. NPDC058190]|uniref:HEAT repeat domain-containing protein n=1 Tax=Kitasatospora sp. NPDC058190 TaxID=3346371 RepID=UPI0036DF88B1
MTDHCDAVLRLWGRQLYERQSEPLAWAQAVLRATGRPPTALAARLNDETDWVRSRAAQALGEIGGDQALAVLWQTMTQRRNPKAGHLASAIAAFGPPVVEDLIALTSDPDPDLRALACRALGSTADDRALPVLERLAAHDLARTTLGGLVAPTAKQGLRTAHRIRARTAPPARAWRSSRRLVLLARTPVEPGSPDSACRRQRSKRGLVHRPLSAHRVSR